ncbi:MAG: sigma-70 family RNA polymerase sigma factor [Roseivirga sp.]|nr:sigma-70 family RNA polymerase sigma factor [Roseivirga sp.]
MISSRLFQEALIKGDTGLIKEIYKECFPLVKRFITQNNGAEEDAEDIFQKSLLQIAVRYQKEQFEIRGDFRGYLFTVCKNLWLRELNKSKKRVTNELFLNLYSEEQDNALALMEQKRFELFNEKLNLISENCKKILSLYFAKVSYAEMVRALDYNSETVARQRVFKCKKSLTDLIKGDTRFLRLKEL